MVCYVDGSCKQNPGPGGFAVVYVDDEGNYLTSYSRYENQLTTNNEQELLAILYVLERAKAFPDVHYHIKSDSSYAINCFWNWATNWEANGWRRSGNHEILNLEIIQKGYNILKRISNVSIEHVRGHRGDRWNELADALASKNETKANKIFEVIKNEKETVR